MREEEIESLCCNNLLVQSMASSSFSNSQEWEDLNNDDVLYLLDTLPQLQNPISPQMIKLIGALRNHPSLASTTTPFPPPDNPPMLSSSPLSEYSPSPPPQNITARGDKRISKIHDATLDNEGKKSTSKKKHDS